MRFEFSWAIACYRQRRHVPIAVILAGLSCFSTGAIASENLMLWDALRSDGTVALLRHAVAPGTGDPAEFVLADCSTQRTLSEEGRAQARRIGARFRANGIDDARVFSSQWCRCLETAKLLGFGPVEELPALNSFFGRYERRDEHITAMQTWIARQELDVPVILVTHQVNITGLTDIFPASGELVIVRRSIDGSLTTLGTVATD
ncbi:MAG: phosphohistidine phosphatase SixA [Alphaproteobacteria bacterium]|jgi:phosphohistidine phosphatase SixA